MTYELSSTEKERLQQAIVAAFTIPFIDDVEDYIWEAIFSYTKGIPLVDPLTSIRSKKLFDVVNDKERIGWSAKAIQWNINTKCNTNMEFELVIQRADIFKKSQSLVSKDLNKESPPDLLGEALLKHWYKVKVMQDAQSQNVLDKRVCVLLKSKDRKEFAYFEESISEYSPKEIKWKWTDSTKTGLQGIRESDNFCAFRWYPNQKQLFERFVLPKNIFTFKLTPKRIEITEIINILTKHLNKH